MKTTTKTPGLSTDYTPGAGGALTGVESALSSLPWCRSDACCAPARPVDGRDLQCSRGHVFAGTAAEHQQAHGALAAAARRAVARAAERAPTAERLAAKATYLQRLEATAKLVDAELVRRRDAGEPLRKLEAHAAELAGYLDVERQAEQRRAELGIR